MCGFAGGLLFDRDKPHDRTVLERMGEVIRHRGPDDHGLTVKGQCGMVHRRLSVIDLSRAGRQPMASEDGSVILSYNGEVYNYRELRSSFSLDDCFTFRSSTDTEVILELYRKLEQDFLEHLNGMYAIAVFNSLSNRLLLARDPFGVKPLFFTRTKDGFWFGSEIKSLLVVPGVERTPSPEALSGYLAFNYVPGTLTPFKNIEELEPGTALSVDGETGEIRKWRFFDLEFSEDHSITFDEACLRSRTILQESVARTLLSDVPVGVMLSGGMDSSALTALMALERGNADFHTFSLGFTDRSFDESEYASMVADHVGTTHHRIKVTADKVEELLPGYLAHIDEPYADGSAIPTWLLAKKASEYVTVLLSGEGGDEMYTGYDTHAAWKARKLYRKLAPGPLRKAVIKPLAHMLPVSHSKLSFDFKAKRFTSGAELGVPESHFAWRAVLSGDALESVLSREIPAVRAEPEDYFRSVYRSSAAESELNRLLSIDMSCHLPNDLMIKNDRMTMAHSIEARVPFTDVELFRYLAKVPVHHKFPGFRKKALLRESMKNLLPRPVVKKKKVGLEMPYSRWLRKELRDMALEYLSPARVRNTGLLEPDAVTLLLQEHDSMARDNGRALWGIMNYMMWHSLYIESSDYRNHLTGGVSR
ncbi:asparagine synthase (glutamine-hydrolyzing) [Candidatus Fermentibacteria bacterium]|nr:MAG: asparagine synthase (glutamine-hydrolyzing) [Candidatus Fermentibacteria bacterium]